MAMNKSTSVNVARITYILVCELLAVAIFLSFHPSPVSLSIAVLIGLLVAGFFILIETKLTGFTLRGFSSATFGIAVGLFCAWLITRVNIAELISTLLQDFPDQENAAETAANVRQAINLTLYASLGFLGCVLALRSHRDDFAFIIPYVRFRQEGVVGKPVILDTNTIIDGRIINVTNTGFIGERLIIPSFVLDELKSLIDSTEFTERQRGQHGLDNLDKIKSQKSIKVIIHHSDHIFDATQTPHHLIEIAKILSTRILTNDQNLSKIARLQGVESLNINELSEALKPTIILGQNIRLSIVRSGKEDHQGIGYLSDGTMIVVNQASTFIGTTQNIRIVSILQTTNGQLIFAEIDKA
jgi:uncharacterized protein YacL